MSMENSKSGKHHNYRGWEARLHTDTLSTSHYDKNYVASAMKVLFNCRGEIESSIFEFCDIVQNCPDTPSSVLWERILSKHIIANFLNDHFEKHELFNKDKIAANFKSPDYFFNDLHQMLSDEYYTWALKKATKKPVDEKDFDKGWIAIIREFGLFSVLSQTLNELTSDILDYSDKIVTRREIEKLMNQNVSEGIFRNGEIICPALNQVKNHFALCTTLNICLIKAGVYSPDIRIKLLKDDETNHFKSPESMMAEYEIFTANAA
jgi:hypothetical protein